MNILNDLRACRLWSLNNFIEKFLCKIIRNNFLFYVLLIGLS